MISRLLGVTPQSVDSADALAIAIAASHESPEAAGAQLRQHQAAARSGDRPCAGKGGRVIAMLTDTGPGG